MMPVAACTPSLKRMMWPPVIWPSSWAITPCTWFALSAAVMRPEWM
jgi:hypothetical protein